LSTPQRFGRFELLDRISAGGMAEVFRARDPERGNGIVAIKRILPQIAEDEDFIQMFEDEARVARQLEHPHIARMLDFGQVGIHYYIAFEYVNGKDMRAVFERAVKQPQPIALPFLLYVFSRIGEGLSYAHARKDKDGAPVSIVHRDVSPQNIVVSFDGDVKLIDFGIAKAAGKLSRTAVGTIKGKFGYMSPEQIRGLEIDQRTDIFSLGICMWELLTRKRLFQADNELLVLEKIRNYVIPPPSTLEPTVPPELDRIVMKALAKDPNERYRQTRDLFRDLNVLSQSLGSTASREDVAKTMREAFPEAAARFGNAQDASAGLGYNAGASSGGPPPPASGGPRRQETMAADNKGSDLDIFEGLGKKGGPSAPPGPPSKGAVPPAPPSADMGKKTLLGIAAPAGQRPVPPPSAPPARPSMGGLPPVAAPPQKSNPPPPPAATRPAPYNAGGAAAPGMDMDWDDEDEATHIFDKEEGDAPPPGPRAPMPAAGAPAPVPAPPMTAPLPPPGRGSAVPPPPPPGGNLQRTMALNAPPPPPPGTAAGGFGPPAPPSSVGGAFARASGGSASQGPAPPPPPPGGNKGATMMLGQQAQLPPPTIDPLANQVETVPLQMPPTPYGQAPQQPQALHMQAQPAYPPSPQGYPGAQGGMQQQPSMAPAQPGMQQQGMQQPGMQQQQPMPAQQQMPPRNMEATALVRPPESGSKAGLIIGILVALMLLAGGAAAVYWFVLMPKTGNLAVNVVDQKGGSVNGLKVLVDGKEQCSSSPCIVREIVAGPHEVKVAADGYDSPAPKAVSIERGKDTQIDFTMTGGKGTGVKVTGTQPGVKLSIDGKEIGALPQELHDLQPGEYTFKFTGSDRYAPLDKKVTVSKGEITDLGSVTLKVIKGKATVTLGTDGAKVSMVSSKGDRRDLPRLPISLEIDPVKDGTWTIEATKFGFEDYKQPINFDDGQAEKVFNVTLDPKGTKPATTATVTATATATVPTGTATSRPTSTATATATAPTGTSTAKPPAGQGTLAVINALPQGGTIVLLDGKPLGPVPKKDVSVSAGSHTLLFINSEQGLKKSVTVNVGAGESKNVIAKLSE
jgi:serine/threonine-protein kinase